MWKRECFGLGIDCKLQDLGRVYDVYMSTTIKECSAKDFLTSHRVCSLSHTLFYYFVLTLLLISLTLPIFHIRIGGEFG